MGKATRILTLLTLCALTGCARRLIFTTYTKIGLDVSTTDGNTPNGVFGYKRFEGAIIPYEPTVAAPIPGNQENMCRVENPASVFAAMDLDNRWFGGLTIFQVFATGKAADQAAQSPNAMAKFIAEAHADANKKE